MRVFSRTCRAATLAFSACRLAGRVSTKSAYFAPRDIASSPSAPVPANRSSTRAPSRYGSSRPSQPSRTCSAVGRTRRSGGAVRWRPAQRPRTILTSPRLLHQLAPAPLVPSHPQLVAGAHQRRHQEHRVVLQQRGDAALGDVRHVQAAVAEALPLPVEQRLPPELLPEALQLPRRRGALLQIHEVHLDPALLEEPERLLRLVTAPGAEHLEFHRDSSPASTRPGLQGE